MSLKKKFIFNTAIISISKVIESIISFLIIILISRELGAEGLGQYSFIFSFVGLFFILSDWGLKTMMIKDLSKNFTKVDKYISNIFTTKIILSVLSFLFYFILLFFIRESNLFWHLVFAGLIQLTQIICSLGLNILQIKTEGLKIAGIEIIERILALLGAIIIFSLTKNLLLFIMILFLSGLIRGILLFFASKEYYNLKVGIDFKFIFSLIKQGFPFLLISTFNLIYSRIDTIMLGFMQSYEVVGWYNAGYKLIGTLAIIPSLMLTFGFPMLSKFIHVNKRIVKDLFENMIYYSLLIVLPIITGILFIGGKILEFVFNFNSIESILAFQILSLSLVFMYISSIMGYFIAAGDKQIIFAWIGGIGALINILLNIILIPNYSLYGAAFTTVFTYLMMSITMFIYIRNNFFKFKFKIFQPLIAICFMVLVLINILHLHLFLIIGISAGIYILIISLFIFKLKKIW
jgi:O-antigen/teichoic acid export membrane protein